MEAIDKLLTRGVKAIYPSPEALKKRMKKGPLKLYLGIDPSGSVLHLGHAVVLRKLREFQDLGHQVILLVGDFTGRIGDPTDKGAARKRLTPAQVQRNAQDYKEQASRILNFGGSNPAELRFNSAWHERLNFAEVIEIASHFTIQQLEERDMFRQRRKDNKPIYLHEFLYPLLQAYDSVAMGVDLEIGGSDQIFNMLAGRDLLRAMSDKEKFVLATELLVGSDGRKMGKSLHNFIPITAKPNEMYGAVMALADEVMIDYFTLATAVSMTEIEGIEEALKEKKVNPMTIKKKLALEIVKLYHGERRAARAQKEFESVFQRGRLPAEIEPVSVPKGGQPVLEFLTENGLCSSKSAARRLIRTGSVSLDGEKITDPKTTILPTRGGVVKVGKRKFVKIS
jgi:tyrosyl-tRNA synthetase